MSKLATLIFCFCVLLASRQVVSGQALISYEFTTEVTSLHPIEQNYFGSGLNPGDEVLIRVTFDINADLYQRNELEAIFQLPNSASTSFEVNLNGQQYSTVLGKEPNTGNDAFIALRSERDLAEERTCFSSFGMHSLFPMTSNSSDSRIDYLYLTLASRDCATQLDLKELPREINLEDWPDNRLVLTSFSGDTENFSVNAKVTSVNISTTPAATIEGSIYADTNADCLLDPSEPQLRERVIEFTPGPYYSTSDLDGNFNITLPLGTYQAAVVKRPLWQEHCPANAASLSLVKQGDVVQHDLMLAPEVLTEMLNVSVASDRARPGFVSTYKIRVHNVGTLPYSGTLRFTHDQMLNEFSSTPQADSYFSPLAEWQIRDLPIEGMLEFVVGLKVPADETLLGTVICAAVESTSDAKNDDQVLRETRDEICQEIRGAYDPNDIQVFVGTRNADGNISGDDKELTYLIRFQNEGNEDAITVRVVDVLSEYHNIAGLRIGASSHSAEVNIDKQGRIEWLFNDINLAPKARDEAASQGFVKFDILLKEALPTGTQIPNKAAIYFDFNSPVITNTVLSQIAGTSTSVDEQAPSFDVQLFPNPADTQCILQFTEAMPAKITLRDLLGQTLLSQQMNSEVRSFEVAHLAAGVYYLTVQARAGQVVKTLNIVR